MKVQPISRLLWAIPTVVVSFWAASCAVALGPAYTIEKQEIRVRFVPKPEPRIEVAADYQLRNRGTRPLQELELRMPGRRFHSNGLHVTWDSTELALTPDPDTPRNTIMKFAEPWKTATRHMLHLTTEFSPPQEGETSASFSNDAFFLPAAGWSAELLPPDGLFGTGGEPPVKWNLRVTVPDGFQIHTSGVQKKASRKSGEMTVQAEQGKKDPYPFVIAGRYVTAEIGEGGEKVHLWTNQQQDSVKLRDESDALGRVMSAYDAAFGARKEVSQTWIVECPVVTGCFSNLSPLRAKLLGQGENGRTTAEMVSHDTMVVDLTAGTPALVSGAAPSLAASWLGYGQNPAFYEQSPPLTMLPVFAAAVGHDAVEGGEARGETIRRALRLIPPAAKLVKEENADVLRVKSFLFFFALQDRYGRETFRKATQYMLNVRRGRDFDLSDLIASFEQETHDNVAEFVRMWMKHPGVPAEFRSRYELTTADTGTSTKETKP